jgi:hypothetical protein
MVRTHLLIAFLIVFMACNSDPKAIGTEAPQSTDPSADSTIAQLSANPEDSLRDPSNFFYLSDLPSRKVGELILSDSIRALDNEASFRCLDSLNTSNSTSRAFYFQVFKKMISNSDGPLSESIGEYSKKYIETYPKEFANYASSFTKSQMQLWAFQTVEHVLAAVEEKRIKDATEWTNQVIKNCKDCDASQLKTLRSFNSYILLAAKDRETND